MSDLYTPEKQNKDQEKLNQIKKIEDPRTYLNNYTNNSLINGGLTTIDKTRSNKKSKNCLMSNYRHKPVKIVSPSNNLVDIEDPNMLDKMEQRNEGRNCFCMTPGIRNCSFCQSHTKERDIERNCNNNVLYNKYVLDFHSQRKQNEGNKII